MPRKFKFHLRSSPRSTVQPAAKFKGVGIDLVSLVRIRRFLQENRSRAFQRLLTASEKKKFAGHFRDSIQFAKLFAAKEAFFKALGLRWMGLEGFQAMKVRTFARGRFQVESSHLPAAKHYGMTGTFFGEGDWVGAHVLLWERGG